MRSKWIVVCLATLVFSLACRAGANAVSGSDSASALVVRVTSPLSLELTWDPVEGAQSYRIDARMEGGEFEILADVPADRTRYDDFVLPDTPPRVLRAIAVTALGEQEIGTAEVEMPAFEPDPLVVEVGLFEATITAFPTYDPQNPMGSLPPGFDPENPEAFDPSSLLQVPSVNQSIGPAGGSVAVTSPDHITYTLDVPPGALDQELILTLTPVKTISDLPLSGGLLGAIQIRPEGFAFNLPARLKIEPASGVPAPAAELALGFAVSPFSQEFYLRPLAGVLGVGLAPTGTTHQARPALDPVSQWGTPSMNVGGGGTYGVGSGSRGDVIAQAERAPSSPDAQVSQTLAQQHVMNPGAVAYGQTGSVIFERLIASDSAGTIARATSELEEYWRERGSEFTDVSNARLIDLYASRLKTLFNRSKGDCLTRDDLVAADLAEKLQNASSSFWQRVRQSFRTQYGQAGEQLLKDLVDGKLSCTITLGIQSTIKTESDSGWVEVSVETRPAIRLMHRAGGMNPASAIGYRLHGYGWVEYTKYEFKVKRCAVTKVTQYPTVALNVTGLFPEFESQGPVQDFWFRYMEIGANYTLDLGAQTSEDRSGCSRQTLLSGGGDPWAGGFILLHFPSENAGLQDWTQTSTVYPLVFTKTYVNYKLTLPEGAGTITENATYTITIQRGSRP